MHLVIPVHSGTGISYRDGNPLNLRRENLLLGRGRSKGDTGGAAISRLEGGLTFDDENAQPSL